MTLSPIGTSFDNAFCMPSSALNSRVPALNSNSMTNGNTNAYFAKKGEPMYMKEMDADEDGIVSFDEFKDYCHENGISAKEMVRMVEMGNSYREMMNNTQKSSKKTNPIDSQVNELLEKINSKTNDKVYAVRGDDKYDEVMDSNSDDKITYKEYIEYCVEHAKTNEQKSNTKVEQTENGGFKISSAGKALNAYAQAKAQPTESMFEYEV